MAYRSMRLGFAAIASIVMLAITAPAYATTSDTTNAYGWGNVVVIDYVDYDRAFDLSPLALFDEQLPAVAQRGHQMFKPFTLKTRANSAAVLATTQAGWRSGRLRKLSG